MLLASEEDKSIFVVGLIAVATQEESNIPEDRRVSVVTMLRVELMQPHSDISTV
jgi:hypothetical protein